MKTVNTLAISEIKRRGMTAIEAGLQLGPVHITKRNKVAAVILSEDDYQRLSGKKRAVMPGMSAVQWLLAQPLLGQHSKKQMDAALRAQRSW
jgi:hypothetical protein